MSKSDGAPLDQLTRRRQQLLQMRERIVRDLRHENEPLSADAPDRAIQLENEDTLAAINATAALEVDAIDHALIRRNAGEYGVCESCGQDIEHARLEALPHAVRCARCARQIMPG